MRHCLPLTGLKFLRTESCLQLCRVNRQDGHLDLWANLRFTLYERTSLPRASSLHVTYDFRNGTSLLHHGSDETPGQLPDCPRPRRLLSTRRKRRVRRVSDCLPSVELCSAKTSIAKSKTTDTCMHFAYSATKIRAVCDLRLHLDAVPLRRSLSGLPSLPSTLDRRAG
jgi:hypothetical protein